MKAIRLGNKILKTLIRDRFYYPDRLIADTMAIITRCGIVLVLYAYVFQLKDGTINNTTFTVAAWSMFFYFIFSVFRLRDLSQEIMEDVQSGNVEVLFSKPISYLTYRMWWRVGSGIYPFLTISIVGSFVLAIVIGIPDTMNVTIFAPSLMLVIFLGTLLSLFLYSIVGLMAFWIDDINPLFWIVDKTVMILGGSYLPVALFPDFMQKAALFSPFGATQLISHTVYRRWESEWLTGIGVQLFWILATSAVVYSLYIKARTKVSVNGG